MSHSAVQTRSVQVVNGDLAIDAYLALPDAPGARPAVIVIQEIFGVNAHIRSITERFAQEGYVAIAPALYQRQAPGFETGYSPEEVTLGRQYKNQTQVDELLSDLQATLTYLQALPQVEAGAIGCIGFCFGGHVAYLAATLPDIKATASFYGAGITHWCPGEGKPTIAYSPEIKAPIALFFGLEDQSIPADQVNQIEAALHQAQIPHQIFRYAGADHGFFCDQRSSYHPAAAADAWTQVQALFCNQLQSSKQKS